MINLSVNDIVIAGRNVSDNFMSKTDCIIWTNEMLNQQNFAYRILITCVIIMLILNFVMLYRYRKLKKQKQQK